MVRPTAMADWLRERGVENPVGAVVLGSGWDSLVERVQIAGRWSCEEVPGVPPTTVPGHPGEILSGTLCGVPVLLFAGRWHAYEGRAPEEVALPALLGVEMGCRWLLCTNAAGGVAPLLNVGDLVAITDDLEMCDWRTCRAPDGGRARPAWCVAPGSPRTHGRGPAYSARLLSALSEAAVDASVRLWQGVLAMMPGPNYETPAEVRMLRLMNATVVSMSTVPEARAARALGLEVAAISCVTNCASTHSGVAVAHDQVVHACRERSDEAGRLIEAWLRRDDIRRH